MGKAWMFRKNSTLLEASLIQMWINSSSLSSRFFFFDAASAATTTWIIYFPSNVMTFSPSVVCYTFFSLRIHCYWLWFVALIQLFFSINIITIILNSHSNSSRLERITREWEKHRTCRRNESKWKSTRVSCDWMKSIEEKELRFDWKSRSVHVCVDMWSLKFKIIKIYVKNVKLFKFL